MSTLGPRNLSHKEFIEKLKSAVYDGIEMVVSTNLLFIAQVLEAGIGKGFDAQPHDTTFYLDNAATMKPLKIDSFTGRDYFSFEQNSKLIEQNLEWEKNSGVQVVHEIRRGRFTYSVTNIKPYLNRFKTLRLNADFSHWCCVGEYYLQETELKETMDEAIERADHIHARVGHPQRPQVNDPRAPEWEEALNYHLNWWDKIIHRRKEKGIKVFTITPEFGPSPYLQTLPIIKNQLQINGI